MDEELMQETAKFIIDSVHYLIGSIIEQHPEFQVSTLADMILQAGGNILYFDAGKDKSIERIKSLAEFLETANPEMIGRSLQ